MVTQLPARNASSTAVELRGWLLYRPEVVKERRIRWHDPPHVHFARLRMDREALFRFDTRFGPLLQVHERLKPEMAALLEKHALTGIERDRWLATKDKFEARHCDPEELQLACEMQRLLRQAWRGDRLAVAILQYGSHPEDPAQQGPDGPPLLKAAPSARGVDIYAEDLWSYIRLAFLLDHASGRTRVCANPKCVKPYFLANRKDQRVCGLKQCTAWAQRQWSLEYWNKTGAKRRRQRQKSD